MNKQTEALKMVTDILDDELWFPNKYPDEAIPVCFIEALKACKEALKNIEVGDAEIKQMLDDIEYYKNRLAKYEDVL